MRGSGVTGESKGPPFFPGKGARGREILLISGDGDYTNIYC